MTDSNHRTWLVAHDLTACGAAAAEVALAELMEAGPGGTLLLLHVVRGDPDEAAVLEAERSLARVADLLAIGVEGRVTIDILLEVGDSPMDTILDVARAQDVERVVVGTLGLNRVLGSIAEVVAREAEMPVLVVHAPLEREWEVTEAQIVH